MFWALFFNLAEPGLYKTSQNPSGSPPRAARAWWTPARVISTLRKGRKQLGGQKGAKCGWVGSGPKAAGAHKTPLRVAITIIKPPPAVAGPAADDLPGGAAPDLD